MKGRRYRETKDTKYLSERDALQDELDTMRRNRRTNEKLKKAKAEKKTRVVSDDQLFNEARKYNRSLQKEAKKKEKENSEKEEELKDKREEAMKKMKGKKNASIKERAQENEDKKKEWELYRTLFEQEYMVDYSKENPYETPELGEIDRLAKKNYEKELEIKWMEEGIKAYEEEFNKRRSMFQSYIDRTEMPSGDKGKAIRNMNAHLEGQIKRVRDSYPDVLKVLDKWVAKLEVVEDVQ